MIQRDLAWVDEEADTRGAYVHVPFCSRVCPYCDFAVVEGRDDVIGRYFDALAREIEREAPWHQLGAIFVGGGTPSHVDPRYLASVIAGLSDRFGLSDGAEVTLEANPEDWSTEKASLLVESGFTRVSFGVQSFDPGVLSYLGRRHTTDVGLDAIQVARTVGFGSVSIDLIFGSPAETLASWRATVDTAIEAQPDHVSAYALTVEKGTPLGRSVASGAPAPDPDDQADKYEYAQSAFVAAGLAQYEVSNYSTPGSECRYNLTAWAQGEYLAFGNGAHGHRDGWRTWRVRSLDAYLERIEQGETAVQGQEHLEGEERERERLMLGLRRTAGVRAGVAGAAWMESSEGRRFVEAGVVEERGDRLAVVRPLLTDAVARSILSPS